MQEKVIGDKCGEKNGDEVLSIFQGPDLRRVRVNGAELMEVIFQVLSDEHFSFDRG